MYRGRRTGRRTLNVCHRMIVEVILRSTAEARAGNGRLPSVASLVTVAFNDFYSGNLSRRLFVLLRARVCRHEQVPNKSKLVCQPIQRDGRPLHPRTRSLTLRHPEALLRVAHRRPRSGGLPGPATTGYSTSLCERSYDWAR
ncbi:hypothetical protein BN2476_170214 [Paraburkholderia piptadeniae]|uniref:Uncharacterized protein n=1 Tax=Paraburkholderia piptadeniae TaxID=1701573 RepID=A0A1N7RU50_9BURK|nr:hypothetical protein BN2476_170214 [Paraburkholderia piptadeniae]